MSGAEPRSPGGKGARRMCAVAPDGSREGLQMGGLLCVGFGEQSERSLYSCGAVRCVEVVVNDDEEVRFGWDGAGGRRVAGPRDESWGRRGPCGWPLAGNGNAQR